MLVVICQISAFSPNKIIFSSGWCTFYILGGQVFTRWGSKGCPPNDSKLVYDGEIIHCITIIHIAIS